MERTLNHDTKDCLLVAGGKVRHVSGGPEMFLTGFIHPLAFKLFSTLTTELLDEHERFVAKKVQISNMKEIGFFPDFDSEVFYGHIFNSNGKLQCWYYPGKFASSFKCLCRYYSSIHNDIIYKLFNPLELVFLNND